MIGSSEEHGCLLTGLILFVATLVVARDLYQLFALVVLAAVVVLAVATLARLLPPR